jgi:hypothetical protein
MWVMGGGTPFLNQMSVLDTSVQASVPETMPTVQVYYPGTNSWVAGPAQNVGRSFQGAASVGDTIVSVGGYNGFSTTAVTESFLRQRLNMLLVYSDVTFPSTLQTQLLSLPGVGSVDLFDAFAGTPTLAQMQGYDVVVPWSNFPFGDADTLGNRLADYVDNGGVVVELSFDWFSSGSYHIGGRWVTGGYSAFNLTPTNNYSTATLGVLHVPGSQLLAGVSNLSVYYRQNSTASVGATLIADWSDTNPLLALKGHVVGVTGYFGDYPPHWSGDIGRIITNSGFSLRKPNIICNISRVFLPISLKGQ